MIFVSAVTSTGVHLLILLLLLLSLSPSSVQTNLLEKEWRSCFIALIGEVFPPGDGIWSLVSSPLFSASAGTVQISCQFTLFAVVQSLSSTVCFPVF